MPELKLAQPILIAYDTHDHDKGEASFIHADTRGGCHFFPSFSLSLPLSRWQIMST